jgi:hypothetical protein
MGETLTQKWWRIARECGVDTDALNGEQENYLAELEKRDCPPSIAAEALKFRSKIEVR